MSAVTKKAAAEMVKRIRSANVGSHAMAVRTRGGTAEQMAGFLGGLESVLRRFLEDHGCTKAAAELVRAMNDVPTAEEIDAHNVMVSRLLKPAMGAAS